MARGRKRKFNPNIPSHIDQSALPKGIYYSVPLKAWYIFVEDLEGKRNTKVVAGNNARLSELHDIIEKRKDEGILTLERLCFKFEESARFRKLASKTQKEYKNSRNVLCSHALRTGGTVGELLPKRISKEFMQRLIDKIADGSRLDDNGNLIPTPAKARAVKSYASAMFSWSDRRGYVKGNPAKGLELPDEIKNAGMPDSDIHDRVIEWCRINSKGALHRAHRSSDPGVPAYLMPALEIAYICRLRSVELTLLTDASDLDGLGLWNERVKGSDSNITKYSPRLKAAVELLRANRKVIWDHRNFPFPMKPENRPLIVNTFGEPITTAALRNAWRRMWLALIDEGIVPKEAKFKLHGLKHRGITDTPGNKQRPAGHKSPGMTERYDHEVYIVEPADRSSAPIITKSTKKPI